MALQNKVQLITYVDRFSAGDISTFHGVLNKFFGDLFGGVHLLPFYETIDGEDAGFDPINHCMVDSRLGDWNNINALASEYDVMADLIINHMSSDSEQFKNYKAMGNESPYAGMFLRYRDVFVDGASEEELLKIYRPRPGLPFTKIKVAGKGDELFWTTFTSKQIDINIFHEQGKKYIDEILSLFAHNGVNITRLDAAGYAVKNAATNSFMTEETFQYIEEFSVKANQSGIDVLVEIHSHHQTQIEIAKRVDWVYDFALPPLVLHTLYTSNSAALKKWLSISPRNCISVLDTHDGIGIVDVGEEGDKPGLLNKAEIDSLVEQIHIHSNGESRKSTGHAASNLDIYQVNCTYYSALAKNDNDYLLARLIQFVSPGIPQVYYVGLLAGENDMELLQRTQVGRDVNRHYYSQAEITEKCQRGVVQSLFKLIRFRNVHPAFSGAFNLQESADNELVICWESDKAVLSVTIQLQEKKFVIESQVDGVILKVADWNDLDELTQTEGNDSTLRESA